MLVVVPASLRLAWAEELAKWLPHVRPSQVHVIEGRTDRLSGSDLPKVRSFGSTPSHDNSQTRCCSDLEACLGLGLSDLTILIAFPETTLVHVGFQERFMLLPDARH